MQLKSNFAALSAVLSLSQQALPPRPSLPPDGPHPHPQALFPVRPPGYSPQMPVPPPGAFLPPPRPPFEAQPQEKAAQMYLRIAKQTANGRQEQLAREQKAEAVAEAETPASPPPPAVEAELEPRAWKLIALDVPLKTPYPLMRLPHDLPYSRSDPRLTGQLRLAGAKQESPQPPLHPQQPPPLLQPPPPAPQPAPTPPAPVSAPAPAPASAAAADLAASRTYTPALSQPKDPRLGRPEVPAALLQKPPPALPLEVDLEPPDRPPPKMQLSERSSSFQAAAPAQHESRAYLLDPRFRRRKASLPSNATPEQPEAKNTTPVPSSGESSPVE